MHDLEHVVGEIVLNLPPLLHDGDVYFQCRQNHLVIDWRVQVKDVGYGQAITIDLLSISGPVDTLVRDVERRLRDAFDKAIHGATRITNGGTQ